MILLVWFLHSRLNRRGDLLCITPVRLLVVYSMLCWTLVKRWVVCCQYVLERAEIPWYTVSARNWSLRREFLPVKGTPFARSALPRSEHFTLCDLHLTSGTTLSLHLNLKGGSGKRKRSDSDQLLASDTDTTADYTTSYGWLHPANRDWAWRRPTDSAPLAQINVTNRPPTFPIPHLNWFEKVHRCKVGDMPMVSLEELQEGQRDTYLILLIGSLYTR